MQPARTKVSAWKIDIPSEVASFHDMQLSFESLTAWQVSDVFKITQNLSRGQITDIANELALAGTELS